MPDHLSKSLTMNKREENMTYSTYNMDISFPSSPLFLSSLAIFKKSQQSPQISCVVSFFFTFQALHQ